MTSEITGNTPNQVYDASSIEVLTGLKAVRRRPGMYIGDTSDGSGLHNMIYYWVEQFALPDAKTTASPRIDVTLHANGAVTIVHDGKGLPVALDPRAATSMVESILTNLSPPDHFGLAIVNALSARLELTLWTGGKEYSLAYENGEALYSLDLVGTSLGRQGLRATFLPSKEIFGAIEFDYALLEQRFHELAFFNPGLLIALNDQRRGREKAVSLEFHQGLADFLRYLDRTNEPLIAGPFTVSGTHDGIAVDAAMHWSAGREENIVCFTNQAQWPLVCYQIRQPLGGTHCDGARSAVIEVVRTFSAPDGVPIAVGDVCAGLTCVLSVTMDAPRFAGATKDELASPEARAAVLSVIAPALAAWFTEHPQAAERVAGKIADAAIARQAAGDVGCEGQQNER